MKKCFTLLAILGLLSICLVSSLYAAAPVIADLPDLKLFQGTGLSSAFDLTAFNSSPDQADSATTITNFGGAPNSIVAGSSATLAGTTTTFTVAQSLFNASTVGTYQYRLTNAGGNATGTSKAKWASYKIKKLPKIGLNVGSSYTIDLIGGGYVTATTGAPLPPPSFGNVGAVSVSDLSKVTAVWANTSTLTITQLAAAASPVNVDIIAAPIASAPFGANLDKERIVVATNIQTNSTFSTSADTSTYAYESSVGKPTIVAPGFSANVADAAGSSASGVATFTFADNQGGVKASAVASNRPVYSAGQWYIARARVFANAGNSHQFQLFNFSNDLLAAPHVDVAANVLFGVPSTWTWVETPLLVYATGTAIVQFQWKAGAAGSGNIDEIQVINVSPTLADAGRSATRLRYVYGDFNVAADTTGYGDEGYLVGNPAIQSSRPLLSVGTSLHLSFSGAGSGTAQKGLKWTANGGVSGSIATAPGSAGSQVGVRVDFGKASGTLSSVNSILLLAVYSVSSAGASDFFSTGGQLIASAEFGGISTGGLQSITNGTHYVIGTGTRGFYNYQFATKTDDGTAATDIDNFDFITDSNDNPNFGDGNLFP